MPFFVTDSGPDGDVWKTFLWFFLLVHQHTRGEHHSQPSGNVHARDSGTHTTIQHGRQKLDNTLEAAKVQWLCCGLRHDLWCVQEIPGDNVLGILRLVPDVVLSTIWLLAIQCSISRTDDDRYRAELRRKCWSTHHRNWFTFRNMRFPQLCVPCQFREMFLMRLPLEVSCNFKGGWSRFDGFKHLYLA